MAVLKSRRLFRKLRCSTTRVTILWVLLRDRRTYGLVPPFALAA